VYGAWCIVSGIYPMGTITKLSDTDKKEPSCCHCILRETELAEPIKERR
jgi:hypothetical protein